MSLSDLLDIFCLPLFKKRIYLTVGFRLEDRID